MRKVPLLIWTNQQLNELDSFDCVTSIEWRYGLDEGIELAMEFCELQNNFNNSFPVGSIQIYTKVQHYRQMEK